MFNGQVDEIVIAETTGYKSLKALRSYEHTCKEKLQNVSREQVTQIVLVLAARMLIVCF